MKQTIIFFTGIIIISMFFLAGCEKYDKRTYHKVKGVGYVFDRKTKEPVPNARVLVYSSFKSNGWGTTQPIEEYFSVDINGYFCVKFLKRTQRDNVTDYSITAGKDNYNSSSTVSFPAENLKGLKGVIKVDTLWLTPRLHNK